MSVRINLLSWFSVVFCFAFVGTSSAQTSAPPGPVIHSTTRLVQVSVVVQEKKGNLGKDGGSRCRTVK
jgi:MFS superfamily sulfate permease-like transporter